MHIAEKYTQLGLVKENYGWLILSSLNSCPTWSSPENWTGHERQPQVCRGSVLGWGKRAKPPLAALFTDWLQCRQLGPCRCAWKPHRPAIGAEAQLHQEVCVRRLWQPHQAVEVSGVGGLLRGALLTFCPTYGSATVHKKQDHLSLSLLSIHYCLICQKDIL